MDDFLKEPTRPFKINPDQNVSQLLEKMGHISFQGRALSRALDIWKHMLKDKRTIFLGLAGALVPAGFREMVAYLIKNRFIDCLVSTGANLFHDCHETLGRYHFVGDEHADDVLLKDKGIDRIYDTFALESEFRKTDEWVSDMFTFTLDPSRVYTTREFFYLLGKELSRIKKNDGILTSAFEAKVPVYCPAVADSSIGIAVASHNRKFKRNFLFDVIADVNETAEIVMRYPHTGVIYLGGGVPKNFIQQAEVTASFYAGHKIPGHQYAIQITTDAPYWGGLSGCTFKEAQSWGKIHKKAKMATVHSDATIAFPFLVTALSQSEKENLKKRKFPKFELEGEFKIEY
ncbi:MAG: deoxyhypusine synthase [Candidatus Zixiibacteriota bacterium]